MADGCRLLRSSVKPAWFQDKSRSKRRAIPTVRKLSRIIDVTGRIITLDALHAKHEAARYLLARQADYVVTAIGDNQKTILDDLKAIDFTNTTAHETVEKGHGSLERCHCAVVDLSGAEWDGYAVLYGYRQAMRIERKREIAKTGKRSRKITWCLTSLGPESASHEEVLDLVRSHWTIEN